MAKDGEMALEMFRAYANTIDLVILDLIMPKMGGIDCLKAMRKIDPQVKVVIETGYMTEEKVNQLKELGIQGIINKPGTVQNIQSAIKDAMSWKL